MSEQQEKPLPECYDDHHCVIWYDKDKRRCTSWVTNEEMDFLMRVRKKENLYQRGLNDGLEQAAMICDEEKVSGDTGTEGDIAYNHAIRDCIEAIRAQIKK